MNPPLLNQSSHIKRFSLNFTLRRKPCSAVPLRLRYFGVDENGNLFTLDLHEKFHGPHGLVAGMTGSGKSEFIITYILSTNRMFSIGSGCKIVSCSSLIYMYAYILYLFFCLSIVFYFNNYIFYQ